MIKGKNIFSLFEWNLLLFLMNPKPNPYSGVRNDIFGIQVVMTEILDSLPFHIYLAFWHHWHTLFSSLHAHRCLQLSSICFLHGIWTIPLCVSRRQKRMFFVPVFIFRQLLKGPRYTLIYSLGCWIHTLTCLSLWKLMDNGL